MDITYGIGTQAAFHFLSEYFLSNHYPFVSQDLVWDSIPLFLLYEVPQEGKNEILSFMLIQMGPSLLAVIRSPQCLF